MKELLMKAVSSGVVSGIATYALFSSTPPIEIAGISLPVPILTGLSVGAGSAVSDLVAENLIEKLNLPQNVENAEKLAVKGGVAGAAATGVLILAAGLPPANSLTTIALGMGSKLTGDYVYDTLWSPQHGILPFY